MWMIVMVVGWYAFRMPQVFEGVLDFVAAWIGMG
jgi:hypothetical protein